MTKSKKLLRTQEVDGIWTLWFEDNQFTTGNPIDAKAKVTVNGQVATASDLQKGDEVSIDGNPAVAVDATGPERTLSKPKGEEAPPTPPTEPEHTPEPEHAPTHAHKPAHAHAPKKH
jgi:hypothetical protein